MEKSGEISSVCIDQHNKTEVQIFEINILIERLPKAFFGAKPSPKLHFSSVYLYLQITMGITLIIHILPKNPVTHTHPLSIP